MAQAGYTPLSLYHSTTPSAVPLAADLVAGELAINIADGLLYYKNSSGVVTPVNSVSGVSTFSAGTTGFTPSSPTGGVVTLAGTLATTNGGTGLTSFTANRVFYASSTSAIGSSANLTFDGSYLTVDSVRIGRGGSSVSSNIAVGQNTLNTNTVGTNNTAIGAFNLQFNNIGSFNTAVGSPALSSCSSADRNTGVGYAALNNTTIGGQNTAIGAQAMQANSQGTNNVAVGDSALFTNNTGQYNVAVGSQSLRQNVVGEFNTAVGSNSARNTTSSVGLNTAVGYNSLYTNSNGGYNTAIGTSALYSSTVASYNTAVGYNGLLNTTLGDYNTAIGPLAGSSNTLGTNNTFIGYNSLGASGTANNNITLGNSSITTLRCQVTTITALSDERDKTNIKDIPAGLNFIEELRPVSFDWNTRDGAKVGIPEFGFIAQELQKAQKNTGIKVPNLVFEENPEKLEAGMGALLPVLVKAIQELNEKVKLLESKI